MDFFVINKDNKKIKLPDDALADCLQTENLSDRIYRLYKICPAENKGWNMELVKSITDPGWTLPDEYTQDRALYAIKFRSGEKKEEEVTSAKVMDAVVNGTDDVTFVVSLL